ncbi:hypothetical protein [Streptomyces tailanensis]|uniref:hypothetical protein n=1 Tax=Streptomyces tailanensis TaxID=2569858 RepID=UPI00122E14F8|nr:hypothetical protein [Streptomyces tailanensis]
MVTPSGALVTGCSSSSESGSDSGASSPGAKETTAAAKALGEAELEKLITTAADVKGLPAAHQGA